MDRRDFMKLGAAAAAGTFVAPGGLLMPGSVGAQVGGTTLVPSAADYAALHKFTRPLPRPPRIRLTSGVPRVTANVVQFQAQMLDEAYPSTTVWGYQFGDLPPSSPGPTLVTESKRRVYVNWLNKLPTGQGTSLLDAHILPVDPEGHLPTIGHTHDIPRGIPSVTHLHGGHTEAGSDGGADAWITQYGEKGYDWHRTVYKYNNVQQAGTCWYHDHAVGITRLNVYAGLSGMYLVMDKNEKSMIRNGVLPFGDYQVEMTIQDRDFDENGQLHIPTTANGGRVPSFEVPFIMVNGAAWPVLDVEPRPYRFRILNASDTRFYILKLRETSKPTTENDAFLQVGTELGFRETAETLNQIVMAPAERYDIVIDFSDFAGQELILENHGLDGVFRGFTDTLPLSPTTASNDTSLHPYTFGNPFAFSSLADPATSGEVMKFRVGGQETLSSVPRATVAPAKPLGGVGPVPPDTAPTRKVILFTGRDWLGRIMELQGNLEEGTFLYTDDVTEFPRLNSVETWEIYNFTALAHPIHIHLVHFDVVGREAINPDYTFEPKIHHHHSGQDVSGGLVNLAEPPFMPRPGTTSPGPRGPERAEEGPKDTVICYPNEVTRVRAKFDLPGSYLWHCHILSHEDHDMMRPFKVVRGR